MDWVYFKNLIINDVLNLYNIYEEIENAFHLDGFEDSENATYYVIRAFMLTMTKDEFIAHLSKIPHYKNICQKIYNDIIKYVSKMDIFETINQKSDNPYEGLFLIFQEISSIEKYKKIQGTVDYYIEDFYDMLLIIRHVL